MASEMTSAFRDFAMKKLHEAKQRGATLANVTVATAASITSNVQVPATSFVFRSNATRAPEKEPLALDRKLAALRESNVALKKAATEHPSETLEEAIGKIDLVNESLAFTIENIQECNHVMKMMHRQLRDLGALKHADDLSFYKRRSQPRSSFSVSPEPTPSASPSGSSAHVEPSPRGPYTVRDGADD